MSAAQQAKARRRQMTNNMGHLAKGKRPNYRRSDAATSARRLATLVATERRIQQNSKKKK